MSTKMKVITTYIISLILAFFLVGYVRNAIFVKIDWIDGATIFDKFREYYIRGFTLNLLPALLIAILLTLLVGLIKKKSI